MANPATINGYLNETDRIHQLRQEQADRIEMRAKERLAVGIGRGESFSRDCIDSKAFTPGDFAMIGTQMSIYYANPDPRIKNIALQDLGSLVLKAIEKQGLQGCIEEAQEDLKL